MSASVGQTSPQVELARECRFRSHGSTERRRSLLSRSFTENPCHRHLETLRRDPSICDAWSSTDRMASTLTCALIGRGRYGLVLAQLARWR